MRFASPDWLYALLLLVPLLLYLIWEQRRRTHRMRVFADPAVWGAIAPELDLRAKLKKGMIWCLALAFATLAMARPQWGRKEETVKVSGLDIVLALDVSNSMEVEDVVPSRLKKAKHFVRALLEQLRGDRVGVVAFAASAYLASPLTNDLSYVAETIDLLGPQSIVNQGTDLGAALDTAARALDRGAEQGAGGQAADPMASRIILLISDGEDHESRGLEGARKVRESGAKLYVLGVGTEKGGPIPRRDSSGRLVGYKRDRKGQSVVSSFSPESLMRVAESAGGRYWTISPSEGELDELVADLGSQSRSDYNEQRVVTYEERYQIPLLIAFLLLLLELSLPARKIRAAAALLPFLLFLMPVPAISAEGWLGPDVSIQGWLKNREGIEAFQKEDQEQAAKRFEEAAELDPDRPELLYNRGVSRLKKGEADGALEALAGASRKALESGDASLWGKSQFAIGNVLAQKGEREEAIRSYLKAMEAARLSGDRELDSAARKNLELLASAPPPPPQQGGDQEQKDQNQQDQQQAQNQRPKESKDSPEKKPDEGDDQKGKSFARHQKQTNFQSQKLSKEDAERVMAELSSREKELQGKLRRQRGVPRGGGEKDW